MTAVRLRTISYLRIPATGKNVIQKIYPGHQTSQSQAKNSHARLVIYLDIASYLTSFSQGKESVGAVFFFSFFFFRRLCCWENSGVKDCKNRAAQGSLSTFYLFIYFFVCQMTCLVIVYSRTFFNRPPFILKVLIASYYRTKFSKSLKKEFSLRATCSLSRAFV